MECLIDFYLCYIWSVYIVIFFVFSVILLLLNDFFGIEIKLNIPRV